MTIHVNAASRGQRWKTLVAFGIIYFVWGSTFLAIRVGVRELPPFLFAAMRFAIAGAVLFGWMTARREAVPTLRQWLSALTLAFPIFVLDYGLLFWAEQRVPSGVAALMMGTIPAFTALSEIYLLKTRKLTLRLAGALLIGLLGVAVLTGRAWNFWGAAMDGPATLALLIAALSWSIATVFMKKLPLPASKVMSSGSQMLAGGVLLAVTAGALGEFRHFSPGTVSPEAWLALLYVTVVGSVVGFTAYVWLIHHESPTKVGTYAYVNPLVAVLIGHVAGGEPLGRQTILGALLVLTSVVVITTTRARTA